MKEAFYWSLSRGRGRRKWDVFFDPTDKFASIYEGDEMLFSSDDLEDAWDNALYYMYGKKDLDATKVKEMWDAYDKWNNLQKGT